MRLEDGSKPEHVARVVILPKSKPMMHRDNVIRSIEELSMARSRSVSAADTCGTRGSVDAGPRDRIASLSSIVTHASDAFGQEDSYTVRAAIQLGSELTRRARPGEGTAKLQHAL